MTNNQPENQSQPGITLGLLAQTIEDMISIHGEDEPIALFDVYGNEILFPFSIGPSPSGKLIFAE